MATWHSNNNASAKTNSAKEKANRGFEGVAGHNLARARVTTRGSQAQQVNRIL